MITLITVASLECVGDNGTCVVSQHHLIKKIQQSHNTHPTHSLLTTSAQYNWSFQLFFLAFFSKTKIFEALHSNFTILQTSLQYLILLWLSTIFWYMSLKCIMVIKFRSDLGHATLIPTCHVSILTLDLKFNILTLKHLTLTGLTWPSPRS